MFRPDRVLVHTLSRVATYLPLKVVQIESFIDPEKKYVLTTENGHEARVTMTREDVLTDDISCSFTDRLFSAADYLQRLEME